ncbi:hypothetical protein QA645_39965 [Bradyrhizobium sp. CIAT3101]|uniref:hypothetical protein n=1 Tax=Bradyrhizobium sp. CIAT3101 TaxID=439387 RepID=UPI0024B1A96E|nr:hypothetical protein [Bradyrhizobium sp. CIAT3101]WFU80562.1 hypothetical protein QA645_39965 [Bradyrhizobium sp. CIAT3101]
MKIAQRSMEGPVRSALGKSNDGLAAVIVIELRQRPVQPDQRVELGYLLTVPWAAPWAIVRCEMLKL